MRTKWLLNFPCFLDNTPLHLARKHAAIGRWQEKRQGSFQEERETFALYVSGAPKRATGDPGSLQISLKILFSREHMESKVFGFFLAAGFLLELGAKKSKTARIASMVVITTGCLITIFWDVLASVVRF